MNGTLFLAGLVAGLCAFPLHILGLDTAAWTVGIAGAIMVMLGASIGGTNN